MRNLIDLVKAIKVALRLWLRAHFVRWNVAIEYRRASELRRLLLRNLYAKDGLNRLEYKRALKLIETEPEANEVCDVCTSGRLAIADTRHCRMCNKVLLERHPMRVGNEPLVLV
jgi:hypothetical protein